MDVQKVIDTALSTNASVLGAAEAAQYYREAIKTNIKVAVNLTPKQKDWLNAEVSFPLVFTGGLTVTNDHPLLVAIRNICRDIYERDFKISHTNERTLVVGASCREIKKYNANPHIHYYVHGRENKDYDRVIRPALAEICAKLKAKASKKDRRVFLPVENLSERTNPRPMVKRYLSMDAVFKDYVETHRLPDTIHTEYISASTLLFEDSIYNFDEKAICEVFKRTGAKIAYGYALLPLEMLYPEMPKCAFYTYSKFGKRACLTFPGGYCNGYEHDHHAWSTLLRQPVLRGHGLTLLVELTARVGPAHVFKIIRCQHPESIVREISIPENRRYVKVLNLFVTCDMKTGRVNSPYSYISVMENEFLDVLNYLISLDPKSQNIATCLTYIRRRMCGVSLVNQELVAAWQLEKRYVLPVALTVLLYAKLQLADGELVQENVKIGSVWERFAATTRRCMRAIIPPLTELIDFLTARHLVDDLVLWTDATRIQRVNITKESVVAEKFEIELHCDNENEEDIPSCPLCYEMHGRMGKQVVTCTPGTLPEVEMVMSQTQVDNLHTSLINNDNDPVGLKTVKERAANNMPRSAFTHKVRMHYIRAGPGCGKSYLIRVLANESDLVVAPFTKLKPDYEHLRAEDGTEYNLLFKTTHRAMEARGCRRIFVDEFTSLPYEYLMCIAYVNGAEEVFLVGDDRQTRVREPDEGLYIGNYVDLSSLPTHELRVNFRNPVDTVALLNRLYGYEMVANSQVQRSIVVKPISEQKTHSKALRMCFTHTSAEANTESAINTVRSNQGGTFPDVVVYATSLDGDTILVDPLQIVALSRHTQSLTIYTDESHQAGVFVEKLSLNKDFYSQLNTLAYPKIESPTIDAFVPAFVDDVLTVRETRIFDCRPVPPVSSVPVTIPLLPVPSSEALPRVVKPAGKLARLFGIAGLRAGKREHAPGGVDTVPMRAAVQGLRVEASAPPVDDFSVLDDFPVAVGAVPSVLHVALGRETRLALQLWTVQRDVPGRLSVVAWRLRKSKVLVVVGAICTDNMAAVVGDFVRFRGTADTVDPVVLCEGVRVGYCPTFGCVVFVDAFSMANVTAVLRYVNAVAAATCITPRIDMIVAVDGLFTEMLPFIIKLKFWLTGCANLSVQLYLGLNFPKWSREFVDEWVAALPTYAAAYGGAKMLTAAEDEFVSCSDGLRVTNCVTSTAFSDHLQQWLVFLSTDTRRVPLLPEPTLYEPLVHPPRDMYLFYDTFVPTAAIMPEITSLNQWTSVVVDENFRSGKSDTDLLILPTNKRGHPMRLSEKFFSIGAGVGNHYSAVNPMQTVSVLNKRYFCKIPMFPFTRTQELLVKEVVDLWFSEHVCDARRLLQLPEHEIDEIIQGFLRNITTKHYQESFLGSQGMDNDQGRVIRFSLKGIFKPKFGVPDLYKAGQGISAWSQDACAMFCSIFRVLTTVVSQSEARHVVTDAYMDENAFIARVKQRFAEVPHVALNAVTDGETFDANQNEFTLALEQEFWTRMGVSAELLGQYYSFRRNYKVVSSVAIGTALTQKTSGEPGTLVNNGIVSKLVSNYIVRGEGPVCVVYKGDDFVKRQCNLRVDDANQTKINAACALKLRVNISPGAEFCGLIVYRGFIVPSIPRKINKIIAHRFRSDEHFCEYQAALRDWCAKIAERGETETLAANTALYKTTVDEMVMAFQFIVSVSHIRLDQWGQIARMWEEVSLLPVRDALGKLIVQ